MRPLIICLLLSVLQSIAIADVKYTFSISVVTDWQTVQSFGGPDATQAALQTRINDASKIWEDAFGIQLVVSMWTIPTSQAKDFPYEDTQYVTLLQDVTLYREASTAQCANGATIFMTTRVMTNNIVGYSNNGSACWAQAASVVEVNFGEQDDMIILTHEIGHLLNADHDGDPNGSCPNEPVGMYIMTPIAIMNTTNTFSPCSIHVITSGLALHTCIIAVMDKTSTPASTPSSATSAASKGGGGAIDWLTLVMLAGILIVITGVRRDARYANSSSHRQHAERLKGCALVARDVR